MTTTGRSTAYHQLSWLRAIAAAIVALYHIQETLIKPKYFGASAIPWATAGNSGVQLFFVLSGFVIYHAHHRDSGKSLSVIRHFLFKRFRRVYPTLWIVLCGMLILQVLVTPGFRPTVSDFAQAYLILPATQEVILSVEWTLRHEVLFYALFVVFLWNRPLGAVILTGWALLSLPVAFLDPRYSYLHFFFDQNHLLFLMGMVVAWLLSRKSGSGGRMVLGSGIALAGGVALFMTAYGMETLGYLGHDSLVQVYGLASASMIYGFVTQPRTNIHILWLERAGAASYALYLIHNPIVSIAARAGVLADRYVTVPLWIHAMSTFVVCQIVALAFHYRIEQPILRLIDRLHRTPKSDDRTALGGRRSIS